MTEQFDAPFSKQVANFFQYVEGIKAGGFNAGTYLFETLIQLVAVQVAIARDMPEAAAVAKFRRESSDALAPLDKQMRSYVNLVADEADTDAEDMLPELCRRRSAIEFLLTEYAGTPATALIDRDEVARFDEEIRRIGATQGPVPPDAVPQGLPASHWWWHYPASAAP